jgi:predicted DNA-binding transcriptional regulator YafY
MIDKAELAKRLRQIDDSWPAVCGHMLDTITESATALDEAAALEAKNARLREALAELERRASFAATTSRRMPALKTLNFIRAALETQKPRRGAESRRGLGV